MKRHLSNLLLILVFTSCGSEKTVSVGDEVYLYFRLENKYGERVDGSSQPQGEVPLRVVAGKAYLVKAFDQALLGMKEGEQKDLNFAARQNYGEDGVFYNDAQGAKQFLIEPADTLHLSFEILKVSKKL